jgi:nucleoid-associated protein YgaU
VAIDKAFYSNLPGRSQLLGSQGMSEVFMESMKIKQAATLFGYRGSDGKRYEAFHHVSEHPEGKGVRKRTFCSVVRPVIAQYGALLRSTVTGDQEVTISGQNNLWNIAKAAYGSGYYHLTLLQPNNIAFRDAGRLSLGTKVTVPAMYKIWNGESQVVQIGDSLWGIARRDLGKGSAYKTIVEQNAKFIEAPRRIYPIQLLQFTRQ